MRRASVSCPNTSCYERLLKSLLSEVTRLLNVMGVRPECPWWTDVFVYQMTSHWLSMVKTHTRRWNAQAATGNVGAHRVSPPLTWWDVCFSWPKPITATWWVWVSVFLKIGQKQKSVCCYWSKLFHCAGQPRLPATYRQLWKGTCHSCTTTLSCLLSFILLLLSQWYKRVCVESILCLLLGSRALKATVHGQECLSSSRRLRRSSSSPQGRSRSLETPSSMWLEHLTSSVSLARRDDQY